MKKRVLSILFPLYLALSAFPAYASETGSEASFRDGVYEYYYAQLDTTQKAIYDLIKTAFAEPKRRVTLTFPKEIAPVFDAAIIDGHADYSDRDAHDKWIEQYIYAPYHAVRRDHSEIAWMIGGYIDKWQLENVYSEDHEVTAYRLLGVEYNMDHAWAPDEVFRDPSTLPSAIEAAIQEIGEAKPSRYATVKAIHDFVCNRITYQKRSISIANSDPSGEPFLIYLDHTPYSGLVFPYEAVCNGYASTFKLLCDQYEIPCVLIVGHAYDYDGSSLGVHAWNDVQMEDGTWYAVDSAWDDDIPTTYDYFMAGSETKDSYGRPFSESHELDYLEEYLTVIPTISRINDQYPNRRLAAPSDVRLH